MSTKQKEKKPFISKPSKSSNAKSVAIDFGVPPQVNLLPIEIVERRGLSALKVRIGYAFVILVAFLILGFAAVHLEKSMAEQRLEDATDQTAALKLEEKKYEEVPLVLGQIKSSEEALRDGMYREILWKDYLGSFAGTVPDNGIIKEIKVKAATPNTVGPDNSDELQEPSVGELEFSVNLEELPDTAAWIEALNKVPGFADARLGAAVHFLSADNEETIEFTGTVRLLESIYSQRFEPVEEDEVKD